MEESTHSKSEISSNESEEMNEEVPVEITVRGLLIVLVLGIVMASANVYLGLYIGLSISVSIPSAIIAVSILKSFGTSIQEINAIQTGSSAGSLVAVGLIFTIPALVIIDYWDSVHWIETSIVALVGGIIGVLFSIPIRRALIIEQGLFFPEGVATAEVLKTILPPEIDKGSALYESTKFKTRKGLFLLAFGALFGVIVKSGSSAFFLWDSVASWGVWINYTVVLYFGITLSPALTSIGYIVGLQAATMMMLGSVFCWWIATPLTMYYQDITYSSSDDAVDISFDVWNSDTRYIGIGAMLFGGIGTIILLSKSIFKGIQSGIKAFIDSRKSGMGNISREDRDIPIPIIIVSILLFIIPLFGLCWYFVETWYVGMFSAICMMVFGFLFSCVGAYMAGLVGSSQSPISGVTLATVITAALLLLIFYGFDNPLGPPTAILIGAVICVASSVSGDSMQDLKTGHIVGSTPYKQQIMQMFGMLLPSALLPGILTIVLQAYGVGEPTEEYPEPLIAPQANLVADIAHAIFFGGAPIWMIVIGGVLATIIVIMDFILICTKAPFRLFVLSIALGLYLPFENNMSIFMGSVIAVLTNYILKRKFPNDSEAQEENFRFGLLFCAGVITGEALTGILFAIPVVVSGNVYILSVDGGPTDRYWPGLLLLLFTMIVNLIIATYPAFKKNTITIDSE